MTFNLRDYVSTDADG